jgi:hypothetical protein
MDTILESVALYWLTETFPAAIYPYRQVPHHDPSPYLFLLTNLALHPRSHRSSRKSSLVPKETIWFLLLPQGTSSHPAELGRDDWRSCLLPPAP